MNIFSKVTLFIFSGILYASSGFCQISVTVPIPLNNLEAFQNPDKNWVIGSDASADFNRTEPIKTVNGYGLVASMPVKNGSDLITKESFGDLDLSLDFMLSKGATSGVYLQGRYKIQLTDSWTKLDPTFADMGGIGKKIVDFSSSFNGNAPIMNVARAPGLWQHLRVKFRAPKFNTQGTKISNAYFEEIYLNGVLVQAYTEVSAPTQGAMFIDEKTTGPLILNGAGTSVAFRNINPGSFPEIQMPASSTNPKPGRTPRVVNPVILNPDGETYTFRSFLNFDGKKRTYVVSVGSLNQTNYSYDVKQGALLQIWRGKFLDVTNMWDQRGEPQLAIPLGSVISLSASPTFATLADENTFWPDSIAFDDMHNKGYTLDKDRIPTFRYEVAGYKVFDKISPQTDGKSLVRELIVTNAPKDLFCRIAYAKVIESLGKGLYVIGDKSYYIQLNESIKASVRKVTNGQELIVAVTNAPSPLTYSIIW